jgi:hypothetical protein
MAQEQREFLWVPNVVLISQRNPSSVTVDQSQNPFEVPVEAHAVWKLVHGESSVIFG